jgi:hypothetical protein
MTIYASNVRALQLVEISKKFSRLNLRLNEQSDSGVLDSRVLQFLSDSQDVLENLQCKFAADKQGNVILRSGNIVGELLLENPRGRLFIQILPKFENLDIYKLEIETSGHSNFTDSHTELNESNLSERVVGSLLAELESDSRFKTFFRSYQSEIRSGCPLKGRIDMSRTMSKLTKQSIVNAITHESQSFSTYNHENALISRALNCSLWIMRNKSSDLIHKSLLKWCQLYNRLDEEQDLRVSYNSRNEYMRRCHEICRMVLRLANTETHAGKLTSLSGVQVNTADLFERWTGRLFELVGAKVSSQHQLRFTSIKNIAYIDHLAFVSSQNIPVECKYTDVKILQTDEGSTKFNPKLAHHYQILAYISHNQTSAHEGVIVYPYADASMAACTWLNQNVDFRSARILSIGVNLCSDINDVAKGLSPLLKEFLEN